MKPAPSLKRLILLPGILLGSCAFADTGQTDPAAVPIQEILQQTMETADIPGIGAVVTSSSQVIDLAVLGVKRVDQDTPIEPDDPFHIGSVTKPMTATVIARLVQQGKLDWNVSVAHVLPDVMASARKEFRGVTLEHLLAHEAGLQPMEEDVELDGVPELTGDIRSRRRQFARWIFRQAPTVEPMGDYRYSNAHFVVAASMAEAVSGKSWEELIEEHVFAELEFGRAGFGWPGKQGEDFPWGHMFRDNEFRAVDPNGDYQLPAYFAPAGDVHASLADMAGFLRAYLQAWQGKGNYLHPDLVRRMLTRRLGSGLGWGATKAFDHEPVATYSGSADTFLMIVVMIPDADVAVAIVANAYSELVEQALVQALREIVRLHVAKVMPD